MTDLAALRDTADQAEQAAAKARRQADAAAAAEAHRRADRLRAYDQQLVAGYDEEAADVEVDEARAAFLAAVAESPALMAWARWKSAERVRAHRASEVKGAASRLGQHVDVFQTSSGGAQAWELLGMIDKLADGLAADALAQREAERQQAAEAQ